MSLDPPTYILSLQNNIRARPISWEGAVRAKTISDSDLKKIKAIDKVRQDQRRQTIEAELDGYSTLLLGSADGKQPSIFQSAAKRPDIVQYMLVLAGDLVDDIPTFVSALLKHPKPYAPFVPLLGQSSNPEEAIPLLAASVLSSLISQALVSSAKTAASSGLNDALPKTFGYLTSLAKSSDAGLQDIAVQSYSSLLRTDASRTQFWEQRQDTLAPLIDILRAAAGANGRDGDSALWSGGSVRPAGAELGGGIGGGVGLQLLYHVLLVIWQLSFEGELVGEGLEDEHDIIPLYTQLLRISPKEKTTRLLLSTMSNLLTTNPRTLLPAASLARLPTVLQTLKTRHLTDPDLLEDLNALSELLEEHAKTRTTFDEYAAEVQTGHLRWSPPHRSAAFWRENARRIIEDTGAGLPRQLAEIMSKSWENDRQVLAVACNDVACLVKEVPEKRPQLEKLGLKARVMELMSSEDETVRWEALRAVGEWLRYNFE